MSGKIPKALAALLIGCVITTGCAGTGRQENGHSPQFLESFEPAPDAATKNGTVPNIVFDPTNLEDCISQAILEEYKDSYYHGECVAEGHQTFCVEEKDGFTVAYMYEAYGEFGFQNGIFTKISGGRNPSALYFEKNEQGEYLLSEYQVPRDGMDYTDSIKQMFPAQVQRRMPRENYDHINSQLEAYAKRYLEAIGREAQVQVASIDRVLPDMDVEASNYLLSAYSEYPFWIGTLERLEDGVRYVYEKAWQGAGDGIVTFTKYVFDGDVVEKTVIKIENGTMTCLEGTIR